MTDEQLSRDELKELYDDDYVERFVRKDDARLARLLPLLSLQKTDQVVDLGCGSGQLASLIHDRIGSYVGVDFSDAFVDAATTRIEREGIGNARFECGDLVQFCRQHPKTFDVAFTLDFSEHIYDDQFLEIYSAIHSTVTPGGTLYLHTPNGGYFLEILKDKGILKQFPEHVAVRPAKEYDTLLRQCGFEEITAHRLAHYVAPLRQLHPLSALPGCGDLFSARLLVACRA